mmetsp:Transcript_48512/g.114558  ORF Transcript_48512/g.114558 Transcript_48512/m.114558 type:complete len:284 (+) Transcript_48512:55-906(+)
MTEQVSAEPEDSWTAPSVQRRSHSQRGRQGLRTHTRSTQREARSPKRCSRLEAKRALAWSGGEGDVEAGALLGLAALPGERVLARRLEDRQRGPALLHVRARERGPVLGLRLAVLDVAHLEEDRSPLLVRDRQLHPQVEPHPRLLRRRRQRHVLEGVEKLARGRVGERDDQGHLLEERRRVHDLQRLQHHCLQVGARRLGSGDQPEVGRGLETLEPLRELVHVAHGEEAVALGLDVHAAPYKHTPLPPLLDVHAHPVHHHLLIGKRAGRGLVVAPEDAEPVVL